MINYLLSTGLVFTLSCALCGAVAVQGVARPSSFAAEDSCAQIEVHASGLELEPIANTDYGVATGGCGGLSLWNEQRELALRLTSADGLCGNMVTDMCIAPDGALWVASYNGAARLSLEGSRRLIMWKELPRGADREIIQVEATPDGTVWIAGDDWLCSYRDGAVAELELDCSDIGAMCVAGDGSLWVFGLHTALQMVEGNWNRWDDVLPSSDGQGDIYISTIGEVSAFDSGLILSTLDWIILWDSAGFRRLCPDAFLGVRSFCADGNDGVYIVREAGGRVDYYNASVVYHNYASDMRA